VNDHLQTPSRALRILVAEDEAFIGLMLVEMLEALGHVVCASTRTEEETVQAALATQPDIMIVDVQLAEGNGIAAVKKIVLSGFVPCVFTSGNILSDLPARSIVIQKPYGEADLIGALSAAFEA
jgi:CheY-like chemotaxis protein